MNRAVSLLVKLGFSFAFTTVLLAVIEVGAFFTRRAASHLPKQPDFVISASSIYKGQTWAEKFFEESNIAFNSERYWPFVVWKMAPFHGETIAIDENGVRRTLQSHCDDPSAYTIWIFGGSTMLGQGAPDWFTIPSLLADFYQKAGRPACVANYGELGWVNTKETIELILKLKEETRKPNLVIFYDGINDTSIALGGDPFDTHLNFDRIKQKFEKDTQRRPGSFQYLLESNTARVLIGIGERMAERRAARQPYAEPLDEASWKNRLEISYFGNLGLVSLLAQKYGFACLFFWQPIIYAGPKPLTTEERRIVERTHAYYNPNGNIVKVYDFIHDQTRPRFFDIAEVFSNVRETLYVDPWHVGPRGNFLVAERMYEILRQQGL